MITRSNLNNIQETGRLGNQLWAIASTIGVAKKHVVPFYFPNWQYQRYFNYELPCCSDAYGANMRVYKETSPYYESINLDLNYDWDLKGYFQSYKYFENYKETLWHYLNTFAYTPRLYKGYVGIHIRRGDYLGLQDIHPVLNKEYYDSAINKAFELLGKNLFFVVFSDDMEWCIRELIPSNEYKWGLRFSYSDNMNDILDFISLGSCEHFITANSSFSWWAAYLNSSPTNLVISPKIWVNNENKDDRVPMEWLRL